MQNTPTAAETANITGGILAGGRGRRMGGVDKGLIEFDHKPLIEHVLSALQPQVGRILISANRNQERYARYGLPVVSDDRPGYEGPLAGFATLLRHCPTDWLLVVPCDAPLLPPDLVGRLAQAQAESGADIAVAHDGERLQPVHVLLGRYLLSDLDAYLDAGERKIAYWYHQHHVIEVDFSDCPQAFSNLNEPRDHLTLAGQSKSG